ncbi:Uncharacterized protein DAT39_018221 [Clarias magur]|uniref:Uncharacterized protein n=1 Tax=Clarias magur TaxID=1594786 RepID=A0A8J4T9D4_CLAMG|nr:Uncharacterized protein DAT39_018221 [Clarias magur]
MNATETCFPVRQLDFLQEATMTLSAISQSQLTVLRTGGRFLYPIYNETCVDRLVH